MNITGIVVQSHPEKAAAVRAALEQAPGVQVHAASDDGRLVVTVEQDSEQEMVQAFERINGIAGVISAHLVYSHSEDLEDQSASA